LEQMIRGPSEPDRDAIAEANKWRPLREDLSQRRVIPQISIGPAVAGVAMASSRSNLVASNAKIIRQSARPCGSPGIHKLQRETAMTPRLIGKRAVVVGAGIAGLCAARVLADYFEHVAVLERDILSQDACHRGGTPQSKHVHGLLGGGQRALGDLFPAFEEDLATAGAVQLRVGLDIRIEMPGYDPYPRRDLGWISYSMSRPL